MSMTYVIKPAYQRGENSVPILYQESACCKSELVVKCRPLLWTLWANTKGAIINGLKKLCSFFSFSHEFFSLLFAD